jgi:hypothetical protein
MENICRKRVFNGKYSPIWSQTEFLMENNRHGKLVVNQSSLPEQMLVYYSDNKEHVQINKKNEHIDKTCPDCFIQNLELHQPSYFRLDQSYVKHMKGIK